MVDIRLPLFNCDPGSMWSNYQATVTESSPIVRPVRLDFSVRVIEVDVIEDPAAMSTTHRVGMELLYELVTALLDALQRRDTNRAWTQLRCHFFGENVALDESHLWEGVRQSKGNQ